MIAVYETEGRVSIQDVDEGGAWTEITEVGYLDTDGADHTQVTSDLNRMLRVSGYDLSSATTRVGEVPVSNGWTAYEGDFSGAWYRPVA